MNKTDNSVKLKEGRKHEQARWNSDKYRLSKSYPWMVFYFITKCYHWMAICAKHIFFCSDDSALAEFVSIFSFSSVPL